MKVDVASLEALPPFLLAKLKKRVIPVLWLGFAFNVINRSNLAFAAIDMGPALGLSQADIGFAAGVFFCAYALMQVPSNLLLSRIGARWVLSMDLIAWGLISSATGLVNDATTLSLLRFLLGLAQAGYYSGCMLYLRTFFPTRASAHAIALFVTSGAAGTILCSLSSGLLMDATDGLLGLAGWRWLFLLQGAPPVVLGCILPLVLSNRPSESSWLAPEELALLQAPPPHLLPSLLYSSLPPASSPPASASASVASSPATSSTFAVAASTSQLPPVPLPPSRMRSRRRRSRLRPRRPCCP